MGALSCRVAARDPSGGRVRHDPARDGRLQRLHLGLPDDAGRTPERDAGAADMDVPTGVLVPRLRLRLCDQLHAHADRVRPLDRAAAALPPPLRGRLMVVGDKRRARTLLGARLALLTVGAIVLIIPFAYMVATSFKQNTLVLQLPPQFIPHRPTTANYREAWNSNQFGHYFLNSLIVATATTILAVLLSSMMAFAFARFQFPGRRLLFGLLLIGLMVPTMMLLIPQFLLARDIGALNSLWGLVFFYTAMNLALNTFLLRSFFQDIPRELEEAMVVDGAGPWARYRKLIMPLSRPALATVAIFTFLASWDEFVWALTVINDPSRRTLPIAIALFQGEHQTSWGLVFAASLIAIAPVIAIFVTFQRQFVSGIASGALKG